MAVINPATAALAWKFAEPIIRQLTKGSSNASKWMHKARIAALEVNWQSIRGAASIIGQESDGDKLQRWWRPILMYLMMVLLVFYGVFVPIVNSWLVPFLNYKLEASIPELNVKEAWDSIPDQLWLILQIGIGGYIASRGTEKVAKTLTAGRAPKTQIVSTKKQADDTDLVIIDGD